jgi:RNA polymerase sigma-70 factor (ECF subfamily)
VGVAANVSYAVAVRLPFSGNELAAPRDDPDRTAVERAISGDEGAFEELVRRHERTVYNLAFRLLGSREDALDAAQDAFLRCYRALPRFRGDASFRTWLVGIAINVCRSRLTGAEHRMRRLTQDLTRPDPSTGDRVPLPLPDPAPDPESVARAREIRDALVRALGELSPDHREVLLLREMSGLDYDEVAAALGCALGTVKSRIARARAALRAALEEVWP